MDRNGAAMVAEEDASHRGAGRASTALRLVEAGIGLIAEGGLRALTIREVAARSAVTFPAVQHHFPTKDRLIAAVFAAIADRHCETVERACARLRTGPPDGASAADVVAAVLSDWCTGSRELTMAVHEMLLAAWRSRAHRRFGIAWIDRQHAALASLLAAPGHPADGERAWFALELLIGLSLMTLGQERPIEATLANQEILRFALTEGRERRALAPSWYFSLLAGAESSGLIPASETAPAPAGPAHPTARKIIDAGIGIVAQEGSSALTFRGVAGRAGVSVTSVTNNFGTRENLIYRLYRHLHDEMAEMASGILSKQGEQKLEAGRQLGLLCQVSAGDHPPFIASYDLVLAAARNGRLGPELWRMRMTRGIYLLIKRGRMPPQDGLVQFQSHFVSIWTIGVGLVHHIRASGPAARRRAFERRLEDGFRRLGVPPAA